MVVRPNQDWNEGKEWKEKRLGNPFRSQQSEGYPDPDKGGTLSSLTLGEAMTC